MPCRAAQLPGGARAKAHGLRGLRGGAFNNNDNNLRADNRNNNNPTNENNNIGFRVASSPSLPVRATGAGPVRPEPRR